MFAHVSTSIVYAGRSLVSYNVDNMTLKNYIKNFLEYLEIERGRSVRTVRNYDFYLQRFCDWAKNPEPRAISSEMIHKYRLWLNRLENGRNGEFLKKSTQNYHLIALRSFLKFLSKNNVKSLSPEQIELAKQQSRKVDFLEADELKMILEGPRKYADGLISLRDAAILELLFSTGMRVSELAGLEIEHINLDREEFTVHGKGDKHRVVFLSDRARNALREYLDKRQDTSPYIFISLDRAKSGRGENGPLTPRSIQRLVERYSKYAGITKRITPHTMRHTFATDLLFNGADIRSVQSLLGHSSITTTQIYTHVTDKKLKEVHQKFHDKDDKET